MSAFRRRPRADEAGDDGGLRWDVPTVLLLTTVVVVLLYLTWELWVPHPFPE